MKNKASTTMIRVAISSISAEVILKSKSGQSMVSTEAPITTNNIEGFRPSDMVIKGATKHLKQLGFAVSSNGLTLTIEGEKVLFEKAFKVKLTVEKDEETGRIKVHSNKELSVPAGLSDTIEKVVFVPPPVLF
jgi:subtilase family serine protease